MSSIKEEALTVEARRAELTMVLQSELFARAPVLGHLLSYLCEKTFSGESNEIKEYSIALDVLGRDASFDQDGDSIVRVHANRLRKRLAEYYATIGAGNAIHISIPVGQYVPVFEQKFTSVVTEAVDPAPVMALPTVLPPSEEHTARHRRVWPVIVIAGAVLVIGLGLLTMRHWRPRSTVVPVASQAPDLPIGLPAGDEVRILAGAEHGYVDRSGKMWGPDTFFTGGTVVTSTAQHIWRTPDSRIYRCSRQGDFSYDIPLNAGIYEMRLHFAETYYGPDETGGGGEGSRIMNVSVNGKPVLANFDVIADTGASRTADTKVFTDVKPAGDGHVHLTFASVSGAATLSAIEILPGVHGRVRPIRIVTRTSPYYSIDSRWWSPDNYYKGGQLTESQESAVDTEDPELYQTERWGNFSYAIPVPPGKYNLSLHFVERRFGPTNEKKLMTPARTSDALTTGRQFNVLCNGKLILREFDILEQTGENRPLVKTFSGLQPNAQGKLVLEFMPIHDYATVSAIEVIPN